MGNKKAAVFPEPVWAHAIRSRPEDITGMEHFCIGVGILYPDLFTLSIIISLKSALVKCCIGCGTSLPVT